MSELQFFINDYQEYEQTYLPIEVYYEKGWYSVGFIWNGDKWHWGNGRTIDEACKRAKKKLDKLVLKKEKSNEM